MLFAPSGKGRKRQKKGGKGRFRPISRKGGQTPLKPPFVTPPFAAAQLKKTLQNSRQISSEISQQKGKLGGHFEYFLFFSAREGEGGVRDRARGGGGGRFFIEKSQEAGLQEGEGPRGRKGVCGELGSWGGGLNIFFRGRNVHQAKKSLMGFC